MASRGAVLPLLRREMRGSSRLARVNATNLPISSRIPSTYPAALRSPTARRPTSFLPSTQIRAFSQSVSRRQTEEDGHFDPRSIERESDEVDVCIVGGGPAGLAAAIRLKQLANDAGNEDFRVILLEKAGELGAHIVSGNVLEPTAMNELLPDWLAEDNPSRFEGATPAKGDKMRYLTEKSSFPLPTPPQMHNHGNYIISLNELTKWLGERAEELGVEVYPGFAASEVVYNSDGSVKGVANNDLGLGRDGRPKDNFERGMEFHARVTLLGEGCHGSLTKQPQTYALGIKEIWEIQPEKFKSGEITHSMGYPLPKDTYGGAWMYHFGDNMVSIGLVNFKRNEAASHVPGGSGGWKVHLLLGARASERGWIPVHPQMRFPGGALIGDTAGFLNVPKIKEPTPRCGQACWRRKRPILLSKTRMRNSIPFDYEKGASRFLHLEGIVRGAQHPPLLQQLARILGWSALLWTGGYDLPRPVCLGPSTTTVPMPPPPSRPRSANKIEYPKPDGKITFDILTSVSRTGTNHEEDQPVHLQVKDWDAHKDLAWPVYKGVENRFCPAGVYEYVEDSSKQHGVRFQINAQNCIHCKTCDIKVPTQDINWQTPQGGEGPKYVMT
ncbi:Electron transfer flavoprotein-ubiquinone oxidoreductase [Penicillium oxalicum]|uniref:Electron transfer flavoprotein-ubiquinone oxidoreductase n=1 Tax=Penicillium oxalicum TaxID=69781 RepID=UPI0020B64B09|nr:Electron transfer flavoprotein-ubiquinone oxidoreductase [Penicillium oxalicum]KAI2793178.1 Electron transfer flavoprotein-ubiquinone oxidoreductase [Penicillium oxalicum]